MALTGWNIDPTSFPAAPFNGQVLSPFKQGMLDIRWDNPAILAKNAMWSVVGVNVYRSDVGEYGPYFRINNVPISGTFYRDSTDIISVTEAMDWNESWKFKGDEPRTRRWVLTTMKPIYKQDSEKVVYANSPEDVFITINDQQVRAIEVDGALCEIVIDTNEYFDIVLNTKIPPIIPDASSTVLVTYHTLRNEVKSRLDEKVFYRLTTVALSSWSPSGYVETPLDFAQPITSIAIESLDYIWREAVRRNNWILEQGGERVKIFIRKTAGIPCTCGYQQRVLEYNKKPKVNCIYCYGTGFIGGYEGPWEQVIVPDDAERRISQRLGGRDIEHTYEVWTGPSPLLTQRDYIVKQTNERYSIGAIRKPTNRGNVLQQHFNIKYISENDIRYKVPIDGTTNMPWPQSRITIDSRERMLVYPLASYGPMTPINGPCEHGPQVYPVDLSNYITTPLETDKKNIPDTREHRGRTQVWENQNY
jgi:hypothetical protein